MRKILFGLIFLMIVGVALADYSIDNKHIYILSSGNVGIGTTVPGQKLSVSGIIESTSGGIKYPDSTTQTSAGVIKSILDQSLGTFETTSAFNTAISTFDTIANRIANTLNNSVLTTFELTSSLLNRGYITSSPLSTFETSSHASSTYATQSAIGTFETTSSLLNRGYITSSPLSTFETTTSLLNRGYITAAPLATFETQSALSTTLSGYQTLAGLNLSTFETTAAMNTVLNTFETLSYGAATYATQSAIGTFETVNCFNSAMGSFEIRATATKEVVVNVISETASLTTGAGQAYFVIPSSLNGKTLKTVKSHVFTVSTSGTPQFQITNYTTGNKILGPISTIDVNTKDSQNSVTAEAVISLYATATATHEWGIDCVTAGTGTKGAQIRMMFQ